MRKVLWLAWATLGSVTSTYAAPEAILPPDSLYYVVQACKRAQVLAGVPFPCMRVELSSGSQPGFAVVPNPNMASVLLVPIQRISGIESPELLDEGKPNWWHLAWVSRGLLKERAKGKLARGDFALAINSREARSQNQLHIHIACTDRNLLKRIAPLEEAISGSWSRFPLDLASESWATLIKEEDLKTNLFVLLARLDQTSRGSMAEWGIAALAWTFADGSDGFLIFATRYDAAISTSGSGTSLIDPTCMAATRSAD